MFSWLKKLNLKNPIIIDVGSNVGLYSLCYSKIYKGSKIYSFEPEKNNFNFLKKNIHLNKGKDIFIFNYGISDKKETKTISIPIPSQHHRYNKNINSGLFSFFGKGKYKSNCKLIKLDTFIKKKKFKNIDFIKIDVEGYELKVLNGAKKLIKKFKPIIQVELNDITQTFGNVNFKSFSNLAKLYNYSIFYLVKNYKLKRKISKKAWYSDIILIPKNSTINI